MTVTATPTFQDQTLKGILFLMGGLAVFSFQDVFMKLLSGAYSVHEMLLVRGLAGLGFLALIVRAESGWRGFRPVKPVALIGRGVLGFASYTCYYLAIASLSLADSVSIFYAGTLFITALAVPILGEKVGWRRWLALLVGFSGVVVVMQPGSDGVSVAMLFALASALLYAFSVLVARKTRASIPGATMAFWSMVVFTVGAIVSGLVLGGGEYAGSSDASLDFLTRAWTVPSWHDLARMAICGPIAAISFYCLVQAYRLAPASVVTPFEYSSLPFAVFFGFVLWGDLPDSSTWIGVALIIGAGIYIVHRERINQRRLVAAWPPMRPRL